MEDNIYDALTVISKRIKEYRKIRGWTQEELAEHADVSANYLATIEIGRSIPSLQVLVRLARALDVEATDLLSVERRIEPDITESVSRLLSTLSEKDREFVMKQVRTLVDFIKQER